MPLLVTSETCAPARAAGIGVGVAGGDAEFFHRVLRVAQDAREGEAIVLVVHVDAIQRDVRLIATHAIDGATARVRVLVDPVAQVDNARLQTQELHHITSFDRQLLDLLAVENIPNRRVGSVHHRERFADLDQLGPAGDLELEVRSGGKIDQEGEVFTLYRGETGGADGEGVGTGRELQKLVRALIVGDSMA